MQQILDTINAELTTAQSPAVLLSFGKDSLLLMALARQVRTDITAIWFDDGTTDRHAAEAIIRDWSLTCYTYGPANIYTVEDSGRLAVISEYSINGTLLPLVTDVVVGDGVCLQTIQRTPSLYMPFDLLLSGYKDCDTHWLADGTLLYPEGLVVGGARLIAPLRTLTDAEVLNWLNQLNVLHSPAADELTVCTDCLTGKPLHWDRPLDLTTFKTRIR
jgi:hypothetical protein